MTDACFFFGSTSCGSRRYEVSIEGDTVIVDDAGRAAAR